VKEREVHGVYIEAILIGLLIGFIRNGRIANFNNARFKGWALIIPAFLAYLVPYGLGLFDIPFDTPEIFPFAAMGFVALIALLNLEKTGMKLFFTGVALNLIVTAINGFFMPIDLEMMRGLGYDSFVESIVNGSVVNYMDSTNAVSWSVYLGKIIGLPKVYPLASVISIGDILVSLGMVMTIQNEMMLHSMRVKGSMVRFSYKSRI
jgi:hypothetical protein